MNDSTSVEADQSFKMARKNVLERDKKTCRFCGFRAEKFQEVHHLDDDHHNNALNNLVTVCSLCHMVHHVGLAATNGTGFLAAIPELTQVEINQIMRTVHVSRLVNGELWTRLSVIEAIFRHRGAETLYPVFGIDISDPGILANLLFHADKQVFSERSNTLSALRLVPVASAFSEEQVRYYASLSIFSAPESWKTISDQYLKKLKPK